MCQHCEGYDHTEDKAALGAALIRRQQEKQASVTAIAAPRGHDHRSAPGTAKTGEAQQA
jgi:hypothetical protein